MSLDNYDKLIDHQEHIKNVRGSLEMVIYDNDVMCKILPTTFRRNVRTWYNNLKSGSIMSFSGLIC
jgi:ribosomal protein L1